jgi:23S rRNA (cytosine1962-C5)-methyltransferase
MSQPRLRLRVTGPAEAKLRAGHPWLFGDSIKTQNREAAAGELGIVYDKADRFLAVGLYDPNSPIRLRVLHAGKPQTIDSAWWTQRLESTLARRKGLFDEQTTGYRLIHGESDGWPGLVLDRYGDTLVLKLYTAAWLPRLGEISSLIRLQARAQRMVLRLSRNVSSATAKDGSVLYGPPLMGPVEFRESGLRFEADVLRGQKTGFFLDQRENRRKVETLASDRAVLNAFSFSGGFSVYAVRGGAKSVTDLDISAHALAAAKRNFKLNYSTRSKESGCHEQIQADAFEWLAASPDRRFDLFILDPPSLAKREEERAGAVRAYTRLASLAIARLSRNGILVACSCSAHVSAEEFFLTVRKAATESRRTFNELETTAQPADHPANFKEAEYLKAIYLAIT